MTIKAREHLRNLAKQRARPVKLRPARRTNSGAPYKIIGTPETIERFEKIAEMWPTTKEIAKMFNVSEPTIFSFWKREPLARVAFERGLAKGKELYFSL